MIPTIVIACSLISGPRIDEPDLRTVMLVPFGSVSTRTSQAIARRLESQLPVNVVIQKSAKLPEEAYTKPRNRYRADKLLVWLAKQSRTATVLGVTTRDISTTLDGRADWGIFGLGYCPGRAAVVSSFRLGKRGSISPLERLCRVAVHEVGHTFGLPHCPNRCVMADAKGKMTSLDAYPDFCRPCRSKA